MSHKQILFLNHITSNLDFRILLPNIVHYVEHVRLCLPISSEFSACEAADYAITLVCRKVNEVHKRFPSKKIVLVGWGLSGLINHQVKF